MKKDPVLFTGAGPGAPDLITVRGRNALAAADYILYTGSLVPEAVLKWAGDGALIESSAGMHLDQIIGKMAGAWEKGKRVVRLHTGDPSLYGAVREQMDRLDELGIPYEMIPGVTAAFAASAALNASYTIPGISQTLIFTRISGKTPVPEQESLLSLCGHRASMAIYLSSGMAGKIAGILCKTYGPEAPCAVVFKASHPEQKIFHTKACRLAQVMEENRIDRHALILVGSFLKASGRGRSSLYDKGFSHGFREGA